MSIIHDMAEIKTGDTRTWDTPARVNKEQKERDAFYSMTEVLPENLKLEKRESLESKIVKSVDRLDPVLHGTFFEVGWGDETVQFVSG